MSDDEAGEVIKRTDLSAEVPTDRAVFRYRFEKAKIKISKAGLELNSESSPGSPQNKALTTVYLAVAISVVTGIAFGIGATVAAALITGTGVTIALYLLIHFTSGQRKQE